MAIAFAIAKGVNCIYSNGDNLTLIRGANIPTVNSVSAGVVGSIVGPITQTLRTPTRQESSTKLRKQRGGAREDWDLVEKQLYSSTHHVMHIYLYLSWRAWVDFLGLSTRNAFKDFLKLINYTSTKSLDDSNPIETPLLAETETSDAAENALYTNAIYNIRSYGSEGGIHRTTDDNRVATDRNYIFFGTKTSGHYLTRGSTRDSWMIEKEGDIGNNNLRYTLTSTKGHSYPYSSSELLGVFTAVSENDRGRLFLNQRGGDHKQNQEFIKMLAQYDIFTLADDEQMNIWYDEFYTMEDGFPFHKPTFYELNALFQEMLKESYKDLDYTAIFTYLDQAQFEDPSVQQHALNCSVALKRILDYMNVALDQYTKELDEKMKPMFDTILKESSKVSNEYGIALEKLKGSELLDYIYEKDITPMYFVNKYKQLYEAPPKMTQMVYTPEMKKTPQPLATPAQQQMPSRSPAPQIQANNAELNLQLQQSQQQQQLSPEIPAFRKTRRTNRRTNRKTRKIQKNSRRRN
jgi:hypothetical protein